MHKRRQRCQMFKKKKRKAAIGLQDIDGGE
jgi:hypothetical protein